MILTCDISTKFGRLHPSELCVELPLILLDGQLAALAQKARSEGRTIGQIIRLAIDLHIAGGCNRSDVHRILGGLRIDSPPDGFGIVEVTLLLPTSRLAELEALASQSDTTTGTLIRGMFCCSLLECSPIQQSPGESQESARLDVMRTS
ncbi:hypothetical protein [Singulisphaera acidiphila]|uniref:hypothetical protein n=1 Tax=Singulisphaera acidiphila TaxID=466153 RepID=UPI0002470F1D|nr:hypothetical protein [Singulisphaera acidiphila]